MTIRRLTSKLRREIYRFMHPKLWNHNLQINGIPQIEEINHLKLGKNVSINDRVFLQCGGGVTIGNNVTLSHGCTILTGGLDMGNYALNSSQKYRDHITEAVFIGDGVWLAANTTVCPGAVIASDCVVAAGAVVSGSLDDPRYLYGGIPARKIKKL